MSCISVEIKENEKFDRLTALYYAGKTAGGHKLWHCICECGTEITVRASSLKNKDSKSCGCLQKEKAKTLALNMARKHGMSTSSEYESWRKMKARCYNKNHPSFQYWGGRGISVCERWANSFENFLEDMGVKPSSKHTLDRINNDGNYEPSNCRWATGTEQRMNQRRMQKLLLIGVFLLFAPFTAYAQTQDDATIDLMQRSQMVAEIKKLRAENTALLNQNGEYKGQIELYKQLDAKQEARIADLKEALVHGNTAIGINTQIENLYKERIDDYKTENARLRTENDKLRKSRDRRNLIFGIAGAIVGAFAF